MRSAERLWTLYDRHGPLTAFVLLVATLAAVCGLPRVWFSDDYREIFRTHSPEFALLEDVAEQFGSDENEVTFLVRGDFTGSAAIQALAAFSTQLQLVAAVEAVESPTLSSGLLALLANTDEPRTRQQVIAAIHDHPLLVGQFLAEGLDAALVQVSIASEIRALDELEAVLEATAGPVASARADGLEVLTTGLPLLRSEIVRSAQRDQIVFTAVGLVLGGLILLLALRDLRAVALVAIPPLIGTLWTLGAMGWFGEPINVVNNVVPVLVLVIGLTDSLHLVRDFQRRRAGHESQRAAARAAILKVGPACALTTLTTVLGFGSLTLADFSIIRRLGLTSATGLALSFLAVVTILPLLAGQTRLGLGERTSLPGLARPLRALLGTLGGHSRWVVAVTLSMIGLSALAISTLKADYRYREFVAPDSTSIAGLDAIEDAFGGALPIRVVVDWLPGIESSEVLGIIAACEATLEASPIAHSPVSILAPLEVLAGNKTPASERPAPEIVPAAVRNRFWRADLQRALVSARAPGLGAAALAPHLNTLDRALASLESDNPGFSLSLNGLLPVSARTSLEMINALALSLALAGAVIFVALCGALRSIRLGLISLPTNVLPLLAIGLALVATGRPLQFTTVTLLTVILGIAVDDTIHLLVAYRQAQAAGDDHTTAISGALESVGVSLIITTLLLAAGFAAVGLSEAPQMSAFGWLACLALAVALVADLVLLPALLSVFRPTGKREPR